MHKPLTNEETAIGLYCSICHLAAKLELYDDETIRLVKERLPQAGLKPAQLAALLLFIDTMGED